MIRRFAYDHPVYTARGRRRPGPPRRGQRRRNRTHYCGAYWGWGFHEDGVVSGLRVCDEIAGAPRDVSDFTSGHMRPVKSDTPGEEALAA